MTLALRWLVTATLLLSATATLGGPRNDYDKEKQRYHREGSPTSLKEMFLGTLAPGDPTFNRPVANILSPDPGCQAISSASSFDGQHHDVFDIKVTDDQPVSVEMVTATFTDGYLFLYCDPFDPAQPESNLIFGDDDDGQGLLPAILEGDGVALEPGINYHLVVTTFRGGDTGDYQLNSSDNLLPGGTVPTKGSTWGLVKGLFE